MFFVFPVRKFLLFVFYICIVLDIFGILKKFYFMHTNKKQFIKKIFYSVNGT